LPEIQSEPEPIRSVDVWVPLVWLAALLVVGVMAGLLFEAVAIVAGAIYVYYNSKKFGIRGWYWLLALVFALLGLPLYAYELNKLRKMQQTALAGTFAQPIISTATPSVTQEASATSSLTKFCRNCGARIARDSVFCEECGAKLA
jgi:ribosomal protein L40E